MWSSLRWGRLATDSLAQQACSTKPHGIGREMRMQQLLQQRCTGWGAGLLVLWFGPNRWSVVLQQ
jgi:hypothetical protein